jgi:formate--tetrahydrofolate ligase
VPPTSSLLYPDDAPLRTKIEAIATRMYGADGVDFLPAADKAVSRYEAMGFVTPLLGDMRTMPGLNSRPAGERVHIDADGNVVGLS